MNLITCSEDCEYQQDGYCRLDAGAPINSKKVNGCSYFKQRSPSGQQTAAAAEQNGKRD